MLLSVLNEISPYSIKNTYCYDQSILFSLSTASPRLSGIDAPDPFFMIQPLPPHRGQFVEDVTRICLAPRHVAQTLGPLRTETAGSPEP